MSAKIVELHRDPPANIEAEMALLGAIMRDNRAFDRASEIVRAECFSDPRHGRIFKAAGHLIEHGQKADPMTLRNILERYDVLESLGGQEYLAKLALSPVSAGAAADYARVIQDNHVRRSLIEISIDLADGVHRTEGDNDVATGDLIDRAESRLHELTETGRLDSGPRGMGEIAEAVARLAEAAKKNDRSMIGVETGLADLDNKLGGLAKGNLIVVAGRPSMGKTAAATTIAINAARSGVPSVLFSLEMSAEELGARMTAGLARISGDRIRRGAIDDDEMRRVIDASELLADVPLYIDDTPLLTPERIRSRTRRLIRQHGVGLVVVDYLQLIRSAHRAERRDLEIQQMTGALKGLAKELRIPVVLLSQLNRGVEMRDDKRPHLGDLRESGAIEQDADVVLMLYRDEYYLRKAAPQRKSTESDDDFDRRQNLYLQRLNACAGMAEILIEKNRHGPTGSVKVRFDADGTKFENAAQDREFL